MVPIVLQRDECQFSFEQNIKMSEEIITIDSGDEEDYSSQAAGSSSSVMSYNPNNYSDLIQRPNLHRPVLKKPPVKIPKKPGQFPPFALFSQENRPKIVESAVSRYATRITNTRYSRVIQCRS